MSASCPRCHGALAARDDIGPGVLGCACGVFFVTREAREKLVAWLHVSEDAWAFVLAQGRSGPTCACGAVMRTSGLKGVEIDGCTSCGGLLLDAGELTKLTGLDEGAPADARPRHDDDLARAVLPERADPALGREFAPSRAALAAFAASRRFHLLQVKSDLAPGVAQPINQPFQWTLSNGLTVGSIEAADESMARQLLAFVTANLVSSRFLLRDGRDNPLLAIVRKTRALVSAEVDVAFADDDAAVGAVSRSIGGMTVEAKDARGHAVLRFERHLSHPWTFTVTNARGVEVGRLARSFGSVELDATLFGGLQLDRSLHREDYELTLGEDLPRDDAALAIAATFLVAQASHGAVL